mmetsp:Transcript_17718/g.49162  ORF Transcript_17718/g.49162 Transcript_17718/m.49162 type:complete len:352 (-) Transcript_17718:234-1289(-)
MDANAARTTALVSLAAIVTCFLLAKPGSRGNKTDPNDKRKRLVVVSGCDRGLGRLLVEQLSSNPRYIILALTLKEENVTALNKLVRDRLLAMKCDVTSDCDIANMEKKVADMVADPDIVLHTIVNNAGVANPGDFIWFRDISSFEWTMNVNFLGSLRLTKALLPHMIKTSMLMAEGARILNLSSVCGKVSTGGNSAYSASKAAMEAWSDSLRLEVSRFNIRVVKLRPGTIKTDMPLEFVRSMKSNLTNAPDDVRAMFDLKRAEKWWQAMLDHSDPNKSGGAFPATVAVDTLERFIEADISELPTAEWVGGDAKTVIRVLSWLPDFVTDRLFMGEPFYVPPTHPDDPKSVST